ncbi:hypothetical protein FFT88_00005 [Escherichia sp. E4930]|nr:hypothetical protein FEM44_24095 [Escherichia sp. E4742]TLJ09274.1 hypothetical protein FEK62_24095 [Escherichia sp. E4742]TLJ14119.1 hypothetical protein FEK47_02205 [Escherichia sp. E3659]TLU79082.1 hypothetical protein FFT88_10215 [Escherichia sp. E4930]TLU81244.1 hypothetical protein FFT88_00005 [Escherichia sp. E4930]
MVDCEVSTGKTVMYSSAGLIDKKRPNTIPVFGPGKWLLGESRALKVGINAGLVALPFKNR